jgi:glyoxylase-like metal-dependent hydrolase (beta-lactamase superfamily II)
MDFVNLTRHIGISSNCYWLRVGGKNIILDAGADPKVDGLGSTPCFDSIPQGTVDAIIITHAHQDHIGSLPVLDPPGAAVPGFHDRGNSEHCGHHASQFRQCHDPSA